MNSFEKLLQNNTLILDGALGTYLQDKGYDVNDKLWSAKFLDEDPSVIEQVHKEYLEAGADIIITSTYQASIEGFLEKSFSIKRAEELLKLSTQIAQKSRDEFYKTCSKKRIKPLVAASVGPYGAYLANGSEYSGKYNISSEELEAFHEKRLELIISQKPDILACETIPSLQEAKILCKLVKKYNIPTWLSFSAKDENHISSGDEVAKCFEYLNTQEHISAVGVNCTAPQHISKLIEQIQKQTSKPIVVYPNSGFVYNALTKKWEDKKSTPEDFAKLAHLWYKQGVKILGGCCQTTPEEITLIRKLINQS